MYLLCPRARATRTGQQMFRAFARLRPTAPLLQRCSSSTSTSSSSTSSALGRLFGEHSLLRLVLEPARSTTNSLLQQLGSPVRLAHQDELASAHTAGADEGRPLQPEVRSNQVVPATEVSAYVEAVLNHENGLCIENNPLVPDLLERQLYVLVVNVALHLVHEAVVWRERLEPRPQL